ncbi:TetR/AcrR family transcriptional regulator [Oceanicaulis sp. LC35]|uniref:TetR/AcrR family transcriptional regulator n=1 Tax=Oceanicaulis sp. LC35 TaxID=3349635 RepID=UPI003F8255F8
MSEASSSLSDIQPRKAPVQARSRERFERILSSALELIVERGADPVSMREIAASADISIASLYQYFPDKPAIIATLCERCNADTFEYIQALLDNVGTIAAFKTAVLQLADGLFRRLIEDPTTLALWRASQSDPRLQASEDEDEAAHAALVCQTLRRIAPSKTEAECKLYAQILVHTLANCLRLASRQSGKDAFSGVLMCKALILEPSLEAFFTP